MVKTIKRCDWVSLGDPLMQEYHDTEWGVPLRSDQKIFEFLCLESFQAGLSWKTILHKRENFKKALGGFDPVAISRFSQKDIDRLLQDAGIIRHRAKIEAVINNARQFLQIQKEFGTFSKYMWGFVDNKTINHNIKAVGDYLSTSPYSIAFAQDLKKRGFTFLGPTTVYAHMQATGMVNDHMDDCFRKYIM